MSTTRSHFQPEPVTDPPSGTSGRAYRPRKAVQRSSLILVAHGDRGGENGNHAVLDHARRLNRMIPIWDVRAGVLNGAPSIEAALAVTGGIDHVHILPLMMSEGYFTETVIPSRLSSSGVGSRRNTVTMHAAIGVSSAVADLAARIACDGATELGLTPRHVAVLLVGHGAKTNQRAREAVEQHARTLRARRIFDRIDTAYLEEPPLLADAVPALTQPTIVVGMFISDGLHAGEDVPALLKQAPCDALCYTGAIGAHPAMSEIIAREVAGIGCNTKESPRAPGKLCVKSNA